MKALTYLKAHAIQDFAIKETGLPEPVLKEHDVLVRIKAISVNPVDYKIRQNRSSASEHPVVLGWDAAGVIEKVGTQASGFKVGDEVYYAGDLLRDGSNAELQAVDSRIIALKPASLSYVQAAAIPLTAITAYEALILQKQVSYTPETKVLIIGGAGGVGSIAIQLLKALTPARVFATASRPVSADWCRKAGADAILNHQNNLQQEAEKLGISEFDIVFSTNHTEQYLPLIPQLVKPFGYFVLIDDPATLDIKPFKAKSITTGWEFMFTKTMFNVAQETQGKLLTHVAELIDTGKIKTTLNLELQGLNAENLRQAHEILEAGSSTGKIVITF